MKLTSGKICLAFMALLAGCGSSSNAAHTYSISGTVSGATAAGVTVSLTGAATASTISDGSGNYSFSGLSNGCYMITPSESGYTFSPASITVKVSGADVTGQNFTASAGSSAVAGTNVMPVTVNGSLCGNFYNSNFNVPCVSVTVCTPDISNCQPIDGIILDTGSVGLRIFNQAVPTAVSSVSGSLTQESVATGQLAECMPYGDETSTWGPVELAYVILGSESAVKVPIQIIDSSFGTLPSQCSSAYTSPLDAGFNGILGVGFLAQDCGSDCADYDDNEIYYACDGSSTGSKCVFTSVTLSEQVQNPVTLLTKDNNGVIVELPAIPAEGSPSVNGSLILGIDTQSNNVSSGASTYDIDPSSWVITTTFNNIDYAGIIDTGSNALYFPDPNLATCPPSNDYNGNDWFCPNMPEPLCATNTGVFASASGLVSFIISSFADFDNSSNNVSAQTGGPATADEGFDWGLPFFFGRKVFVGIEGTSSSLGQGPYWAY